MKELQQKIKMRLLGDPAKCIITFKIKVALLNVLVIYLILTFFKYILNI